MIRLLLLGLLFATQTTGLSGRFTLRAMDGHPLPFTRNYPNGRLMFAIEEGALDFFRQDSVRSVGAIRGGAGDLHVNHDSSVRAFTVTNNEIVLAPRARESRDAPISGEVRGDTVVLWERIGLVDKSGHAPLVRCVYVRDP